MGRWCLPVVAILALMFLVNSLVSGQTPPASRDGQDSLPPTNFSASDRVDPRAPRPGPGFAHAQVAVNPLAADARAVGEQTCVACHRLEADHFTHTLHALGLHVANRSDPSVPVCEACHGPVSAHAAIPLAKGLIIGYT
jgi:hypothetical protein